jgi:hypothetical protein
MWRIGDKPAAGSEALAAEAVAQRIAPRGAGGAEGRLRRSPR